ncbi:jmjC domain-containing protein 4-like isoform X2 [Limulus polyphemus]|uniref:Jumonji domain-containing protein 4 n=1 Tax=Limulus polyphemus TaxID=6850 RepID=A0ABM1T3N0_LIMPO|nr:jmjC domain-containing protein 4-like isoform X2 [Limulus polyphemus]
MESSRESSDDMNRTNSNSNTTCSKTKSISFDVFENCLAKLINFYCYDDCKSYIVVQPNASELDVKYIDNQISYQDFVVQFLIPNLPCKFASHFTESWRSRKEWVNSEMKPNFSFLKEHFGMATVPVADCSQKVYNSQHKQEMYLKSYINYLETVKENDWDFTSKPCLYLKDWHFVRDFPGYSAYTTPIFFTSDWLNEYWKKRTDECDDYQFVYLGPKGSWTPFHADVFGSYSWSANVCGKKKWLLFPPGDEENLVDWKGEMAYDISSPLLKDKNCYPKASKLQRIGIEIIQEAGEVVFVPSGWFHQVWNLEDTISINHNWMNGFNLHLIWKNLFQALNSVEKEISDCKDMEGWSDHCQVVLKAHHGMNFKEFVEMLDCVGQRAAADVENFSQIKEAPSLHHYPWHSVLDLVLVVQGLKLVLKHPKISSDLFRTTSELLLQLQSTIQKVEHESSSKLLKKLI